MKTRFTVKANVRRLLSYFIPYIPHIILAVIMAFAINATVIIKPRVLQRVIDDYLVPEIYDAAA